MISQSDLIHTLQTNIVKLSFTKKDGSKRNMICTLDRTKSQGLDQYQFKQDSRPMPPHIIRVWDIENDGWRSFDFNTLIDNSVSIVCD